MKSKLQEIGLTPAKAALLGLLAVVFAAIWIPQLLGLTGSETPTVASASTPPRRPPVRAASTRQAAPVVARGPAEASFDTVTPTPKIEPGSVAPPPTTALEAALRHDPLARPDWAPGGRRSGDGAAPGDPDLLAERFDALRRRGVAMVLTSHGGHAAQIGESTLRVGDAVDGFEVVSISDDGVVLRPAGEPAGGETRAP